MSKKIFLQTALILVLAAVLLTACGGGGGDSGPDHVTPEDLPSFPDGVTGATAESEDAALAILGEIKNSGVLETFRTNKWTVINTARNEAEDDYNFTVNNEDGGNVQVYYKKAAQQKLSSNLQKLMALENDPNPDWQAIMSMQLTTSDYMGQSTSDESKTTVQTPITNTGVSILKDSFTTSDEAMEMNASVTQGGGFEQIFAGAIRLKMFGSIESYRGIGMTLTTSAGAVKMLLDCELTGIGSEEDLSFDDMDALEEEDYLPANYEETVDGTFTLYGAADAVLYRKELKSSADVEALGDLLGLGKNISDL